MAMSALKIRQIGKKPKLDNPLLIEGLPGIGNVGKVAVDFLVDELKAVKLYEIHSYSFPHSVFVNEDNLVELPTVGIYYKKRKTRDLLFLAGDVQPVDEVSSYEFSEKMLDIFHELDGKELITIGGIGLAEAPKNPRVYGTATSKRMLEGYKMPALQTKLYGVVGPIVGVSGLLVGLAKGRGMDAIALLAETYGHPMYIGIKGAREVLKILNEKLKLGTDLKKLDKEIAEIEAEVVKRSGELNEISKQMVLRKLKGKGHKETSYIG